MSKVGDTGQCTQEVSYTCEPVLPCNIYIYIASPSTAVPQFFGARKKRTKNRITFCAYGLAWNRCSRPAFAAREAAPAGFVLVVLCRECESRPGFKLALKKCSGTHVWPSFPSLGVADPVIRGSPGSFRFSFPIAPIASGFVSLLGGDRSSGSPQLVGWIGGLRM